MPRQIWSRTLHPTKLPVAGRVTAIAVVAGAVIITWRRRHGRGVEIRLSPEVVSSVVNSANSADTAHILMLMATRHRQTLRNITAGEPHFDRRERRRDIRSFRREQRRLDRGRSAVPRWHLVTHLSRYLHRHHKTTPTR